MTDQLTTSATALGLFFTEDVYLVKNDIASAVNEPEKAVVYNFLGKNQKQVLILVNDPVNEVSSVSGRELLKNLLKAMELTANDFALLNYASYDQSTFEDLNGYFHCSFMLAFGLLPEKLGLPDQPVHLLSSLGTTKIIFTDPLDVLASDQQSKRKLWDSLKQIKF